MDSNQTESGKWNANVLLEPKRRSAWTSFPAARCWTASPWPGRRHHRSGWHAHPRDGSLCGTHWSSGITLCGECPAQERGEETHSFVILHSSYCYHLTYNLPTPKRYLPGSPALFHLPHHTTPPCTLLLPPPHSTRERTPHGVLTGFTLSSPTVHHGIVTLPNCTLTAPPRLTLCHHDACWRRFSTSDFSVKVKAWGVTEASYLTKSSCL